MIHDVRKRRLLLKMILMLTIAFIFGQSALNREISGNESSFVQAYLWEPILRFFGWEDSFPIDVRKVAHMVEYAVLGLEMAFLLRIGNRPIYLLRAISYCGLIAMLDETIQYFSGRGPQLSDVWLDIAGATIGIWVCLLPVVIKATSD